MKPVSHVQKTALDIVIGDTILHPSTAEQAKVIGVYENITAREPELVFSFDHAYKLRIKPGAVVTVIC